MKYIQSFYNYCVTFSSIEKGVPAKNADGELKNIVAISDEELEKLEKQEPLFRRLVELKKYRVLNKLPEGYKPAATLVNEARAEAMEAKKENEELKAKLAALEKTEKKATGSKPAPAAKKPVEKKED